ncbi:nSTAND1 domain-containing NTPase [Parafrankia discariae]|uniref:nSTAND1 domain-containing NTPase n=1 Tax=Parafrankia discariae TaxID=365528 RepID=UPI000360A4CE|nr:hypothetical protein [Parafrankia discariae]
MKHDLSRLNEQDFEHLAQALMMAVFGRGTEVYGDGPDGGRDATFDGVVLLPEEAGGGTWAGYGVMQAKFLRRPHGDTRDASWLAQQLKKEFGKWSGPKSQRASKGRTPEYLLVVTNVVLSPALGGGGIDTIERLISERAAGLGLKGWWVWHYDTLGRLLEIYPGIRRSYTGEILPGDVMSSVLERMAAEPHWGERVADGGSTSAVACPYQGLAAFTESDAALFFGREQLTVRLATRLAHSYGEGRPLVVLGASGAGKSSVLAAGLLPALRQGQFRVPGSADWPHMTLTPTATPLRALATALAPCLDAELSADAVAEELMDAPGRVAARLRGHDPGSPPPTGGAGPGVVLVVDQFEELFTLCDDLKARRVFVDALAVLAGRTEDAPTPAAAVVLGIRADFVEHLAAYPALREAVEAHPVFVGPMSPDEVRCAIEQPAAAAGLSLEPGLADVILQDLDASPVGAPASSASGASPPVGHHVGHLPLLSHALLVTCQRSGGSRLTLAAYHATGGIRRAVSSTAEEILGRFDEAHRETARHLLLDLVRIGEGTDDTRRQVPLERLLTNATNPHRARDVLTALAAPDARLVTIHEHHVEITHEALLRAWPTLRAWIDSDRAGQLLRQRLDDDANTWHDDDRVPSHLYQGHRLATTTAWADAPRNRAQLSPRARDFLTASQGHARRTRVRAVAVVAVLATLVTAGGITAFVQWQRALDREQATELARRAATSEGLLARADAVQDEDPRTALRLGVAADAVADNPRARVNLLGTLAGTNLAATLPGHTATVNAIAFAETTGTLATGSADGTAFLWNISDPDRPRLLAGPLRGNTGGVLAAAFTPDGSILATSSTGTADYGNGGGDRVTDDADVILWDTSDPATPRRIGRPLTGQIGNITSLAFTANGQTLITGSMNDPYDKQGTIILWDAINPAAPRQISTIDRGIGSGPRSLEITTDGATLAVATEQGAGLWDVRDPVAPRPLVTVPDRDNFANVGSPLVTDNGGSDGPLAQHGRVNAVAFTADGTVLATGGPSGVSLWDIRDPTTPRPLGQPVTSSPTNALDVSPDGSTLATGGEDGTVLVWDVTNRISPRRLATFAGHRDGVHSMTFADSAAALVTGSFDATTTLWHVNSPATPRLLKAQFAPVLDQHWEDAYHGGVSMNIAQSADGAVVAVARTLSPDIDQIGASGENADSAIELWDLRVPGALRPASVLHSSAGVGGVRDVTALAPDGTFLITNLTDAVIGGGSLDAPFSWWHGPVDLWDTAKPASPRRIARLTPDDTEWMGAAFDDTATRLAIVSGGQPDLWDLTDRAHPHRHPLTDTIEIQGAAFTADGATLILTGYHPDSKSAALAVWDVSDPSAPRHLETVDWDGSPGLGPLALSPDGKTLAVTVYEGSASGVALWDLSDPTDPRRLGGTLNVGREGIRSMTFSHEGSILAINASSLSFWAVADPASPLRLSSSSVPSSDFSGADTMAFTDDDSALTLTTGISLFPSTRWDTSALVRLSKDAVAASCRKAGGGLTPAEWKRYLPDLSYQPTCETAPRDGD